MPRDEAWQHHLTAAGAHWDGDAVTDFGDLEGELTAAGTETVVAELGERTFLTATGSEMEAFFQGQLTADVTPLDAAKPVLGAHLTPKGRVLGVPFLFPLPAGWGVDFPADMAETLTRKLRMYILMADVQLEEAGAEWIRLGVTGPNAAEVAATAVGTPEPAGAEAVTTGERGRIVPLPGPEPAFLMVAPANEAANVWAKASTYARPVGRDAWTLARIRAGVPDPDAATSETFIPQELNLEPLGAISYTKGCYTGQEIVARTKHLGRLKRRLYRVAASERIEAGGSVYTADSDQAQGTVVNAAPAPEGGWEGLAVARIEAADANALIQAESGPLALLPLPYTMPETGE